MRFSSALILPNVPSGAWRRRLPSDIFTQPDGSCFMIVFTGSTTVTSPSGICLMPSFRSAGNFERIARNESAATSTPAVGSRALGAAAGCATGVACGVAVVEPLRRKTVFRNLNISGWIFERVTSSPNARDSPDKNFLFHPPCGPRIANHLFPHSKPAI